MANRPKGRGGCRRENSSTMSGDQAGSQQSTLAERLLMMVVSDLVSEKLGDVIRQVGDKLKKSGSFSEAERKQAKLMILEQVRNAGGEFYQKMKQRIERDEKD